jgi:hypothetical protein
VLVRGVLDRKRPEYIRPGGRGGIASAQLQIALTPLIPGLRLHHRVRVPGPRVLVGVFLSITRGRLSGRE